MTDELLEELVAVELEELETIEEELAKEDEEEDEVIAEVLLVLLVCELVCVAVEEVADFESVRAAYPPTTIMMTITTTIPIVADRLIADLTLDFREEFI